MADRRRAFDLQAQGYDRTEEVEADLGTERSRTLTAYAFEVEPEEELQAEPCGCSRRGASPACRKINVWHKGRNG